MTRALYFDCFSGISGDMTLGALIDLGLDQEQVFKEISKLNIGGYEISAAKTVRWAIAGTDVEVLLHEHTHGHQEHTCDHQHEHAHNHYHDHDHHHDHDDNNNSCKHESGHGEHEERNLAKIREIITKSGISHRAKQIAIDIFTEIAAAEGRVHGKPAENIHFHEVGAVDSIVDIVGVAVCIDMLGVEKFFCSPLQEGRGFVYCRHGKLPVPVPAVAQMLCKSALTIQGSDIEGELITPTGMGIVKVLAGKSGQMPPMRIERTGYGFGKRDIGRMNALRLILGETVEEYRNAEAADRTADKTADEMIDHFRCDEDTICEMRTNIDDMTGEELGFLSEILLENGALDVFYTAVQMKKNRPGVLLTVLSDRQKEKGLSDILWRHSSVTGVRISHVKRQKLFRKTMMTKTPYGDISVKKSYDADESIIHFSPEYEDCKQIAKKNNMSVREVWEAAKSAACTKDR